MKIIFKFNCIFLGWFLVAMLSVTTKSHALDPKNRVLEQSWSTISCILHKLYTFVLQLCCCFGFTQVTLWHKKTQVLKLPHCQMRFLRCWSLYRWYLATKGLKGKWCFPWSPYLLGWEEQLFRLRCCVFGDLVKLSNNVHVPLGVCPVFFP